MKILQYNFITVILCLHRLKALIRRLLWRLHRLARHNGLVRLFWATDNMTVYLVLRLEIYSAVSWMIFSWWISIELRLRHTFFKWELWLWVRLISKDFKKRSSILSTEQPLILITPLEKTVSKYSWSSRVSSQMFFEVIENRCGTGFFHWERNLLNILLIRRCMITFGSNLFELLTNRIEPSWSMKTIGLVKSLLLLVGFRRTAN